MAWHGGKRPSCGAGGAYESGHHQGAGRQQRKQTGASFRYAAGCCASGVHSYLGGLMAVALCMTVHVDELGTGTFIWYQNGHDLWKMCQGCIDS